MAVKSRPDNGWDMPSRNKLNPQPQIDGPADGNSQPIINPNTGNNFLVHRKPAKFSQAMHLFLGQTNVIDWGKINYGPGENGGITGIVYYDTTRAENDPRYCAGEPWTGDSSRSGQSL